MANKLAVLVTGTTGKQGGAVARSLLAAGHHVRALTRSPNSNTALELQQLGAELVRGNFNDVVSLDIAAEGMDTVFAMGEPFEGGTGIETRQVMAIVNACRKSKVRHLVYSSVASANRHTGIPHFESKFEVEKQLRTLDVPYTIVAPVYFMENLFSPWILDRLREGILSIPLAADRALQQIAVADIGRFVAHVIARRDDFIGARIDIASDEISGGEMATILSRVSGYPVRYREQALEQLEAQSHDMATMFSWLQEIGYHVDCAQLRARYPEIGWHRFEDWAKQQDWGFLERD